MSDFFDEKKVRARKRHTCDECGELIFIGVVYSRTASYTDGVFGTWIAHQDCLAATREIMRLNDAAQDEWATLQETVWEMDEAALAWLMMSYPTVYARFKDDLDEDGRRPNPYTWSGLGVSRTERLDPYLWRKVG